MLEVLAVLGIAGHTLSFGGASAVAVPITSPPGALICHLTETGAYEPFLVSSHGLIHNLNGHGAHGGDIIPFRGFGGNPAGQNMTPENIAVLNNGCVGTAASTVSPTAPVLLPPSAKVPLDLGPNRGYNVDGAVAERSASPTSNIVMWLGGTGAVLAGATAWTLRRKQSRAKKFVE